MTIRCNYCIWQGTEHGRGAQQKGGRVWKVWNDLWHFWQAYLISRATANQNIKTLQVEVWTDTVKLYYGHCRQDAPFLRLGR